jgi:ABC-type Fe3+ transport system substrate-binding protein
LLVYELLRAVDNSANIATVQRIVDHLCSGEVQAKLRGCPHVRDGILDEISTVLASAGITDARVSGTLNRDEVLAIMSDCGVTGELMTLVNCVRLLKANAG